MPRVRLRLRGLGAAARAPARLRSVCLERCRDPQDTGLQDVLDWAEYAALFVDRFAKDEWEATGVARLEGADTTRASTHFGFGVRAGCCS